MPKPSIVLFYRSIGGGTKKVLVHLARGFTDYGLKVDRVLCTTSGPHMWQVSPKVRIVDLKAPRMVEAFPKLV